MQQGSQTTRLVVPVEEPEEGASPELDDTAAIPVQAPSADGAPRARRKLVRRALARAGRGPPARAA